MNFKYIIIICIAVLILVPTSSAHITLSNLVSNWKANSDANISYNWTYPLQATLTVSQSSDAGCYDSYISNVKWYVTSYNGNHTVLDHIAECDGLETCSFYPDYTKLPNRSFTPSDNYKKYQVEITVPGYWSGEGCWQDTQTYSDYERHNLSVLIALNNTLVALHAEQEKTNKLLEELVKKV